MNHGMADLYASRKPIENQTPDSGLQYGQKFAVVPQVRLSAVNSRSQVAFKAARNLEQLITIRMCDNKRSGAEYFRAQDSISQKGSNVRLKQRSSGLASTPFGLRRLNDRFNTGSTRVR